MIDRKLKFQCSECGKLTAGKLPEGTCARNTKVYFPTPHKHKGKSCKGNTLPAFWVIEAHEGKGYPIQRYRVPSPEDEEANTEVPEYIHIHK